MPEPSASHQDPLTLPGPWNAVAEGYDEEFFDQIPELFAAAISTLCAPPDATVLDVATGPGTVAVRLAPQVAKVVAIDFAEAMLERLRARLLRAGITNVEPRAMDGQALEFGDASFDAAISMFGIFLFGDRQRAFSELHRVVRPGGRVLSASWGTIDENTAVGAGIAALREALPDMPRPKGTLPTQDPDVCAAELAAAGFKGVTAQRVRFAVSCPSADAYFRMFARAGAPFALLKSKLGDQFPATAERIRGHLVARYGDSPFELDAVAIFTSGIR